MPVDTTMRANFDGWAPLEGEFGYWHDEFAKVTIARKAQKVMLDALQDFSDPERSIHELITQLSSIRASTKTNVGATDKGIGLRLEKYRLRREIYEDTNGTHIWGIRSGFLPINATRIGWMPGELVGIIARPSVGKTWILAREAAEAWMQGYRVLFLSPEMPRNQIALRFDVIQAHQLNIRLSHRMTTVGNPLMEAPYTALAEQIGQHERWWTIDSDEDGALSVRKIEGYIQQFAPDIVMIDGASLLQSTKRDEWQAMKETMYALKYLATASAIPFIVTHQAAKRQKSQKSDAIGRGDDWIMPTLNDAAFGDAFVQACSTVITMCSDQDRPDVRWYSIRKQRDREAIDQPRFAMWVDYDHGDIRDLSQHFGEDAVLAEIAKLSNQ